MFLFHAYCTIDTLEGGGRIIRTLVGFEREPANPLGTYLRLVVPRALAGRARTRRHLFPGCIVAICPDILVFIFITP